MTPSDDLFPQMLEHGEFLRRLARALLADPHRADDVVQEAYLAALTRPPLHTDNLRAWLARVVRNLSARTRRTEARLSDRHARREPRAPAEATVDAAARLETQQCMVAAVHALNEPYRSVVVARFYDGLGPAEIARRTGTPLKTVETRLRRAIAQLRERLDHDHPGGRRAWMAGLLPLLARPSAAAVGALVMAKRIVVVAVALLFGAGLVMWRSDESPRDRTDAVPRGDAGRIAAMAGADASDRSSAESGDSTSTRTGPGISGLVLDESTREPVEGATVVGFDYARGESIRVTTDGEGRFRIATNGDRAFRLVVRSPNRAVRELAYVRPAPEPMEIVVGAGGVLNGRVVDPDGKPIAGAVVRAMRRLFPGSGAWDSHMALFRQAVPEEVWRTGVATSDSAGAFSFPRLHPGKYVLIATAAGYSARMFNGGSPLDLQVGFEIARGGTTDVELALPPLARVRFRVVDAEHGQPVRGVRLAAHVRVDRHSVPVERPILREIETGLYETEIARRANGTLDSFDGQLEHPDFPPVGLDFSGQPAGHEFRIVMGNGGRVEGTVIGTTDAVVMVEREVDGALLASVPVGKEGRFAAGPFALGEPMTLRVYDATLRNVVGLVPLVLRNGETREVRIGDPNTPSLTGRVLKRGRPVPGTLVALDGPRGTVTFAGDDGRFRFDGIEPASYSIFLNYGGEEQVYIDRIVEVGEGPVTIETDARFAIEGVLIDGAIDEPITGERFLDIKARRVDPPAERGALEGTRALESGRFRILVTSPGEWEVYAPGFAETTRTRVRVGESKTPPDVRVVVHRDAEDRVIRVSVLDAKSKLSVAEGTYRYRCDNVSGAGPWAGGEVEIEEARAGTYSVRIDAPYHVGADLTVELAGKDRAVKREVALVRSDSVRIVEVMDGGAAKPAGMRVGDMIVRYGNKPVNNLPELGRAIGEAKGSVAVELRREGQALSVTIVAGRMGIRGANHRLGE
ncbi:MAG: sigma-70 family RNA polymerase sigma factor [Planctomycetota bacterium]|jgi:RNA polymerase sigma-70 factor (ECF subfamily)